MRFMMKRASIIRLAVFAAIAFGLPLATVSVCAAQDTAPSSADLAKRIDELEKELAALKSHVTAQPEPAAAAPAASATSEPAPAHKRLADLL